VHSTLQIIPDPTVYSIADMDLLLHSLAPIESLCISFGLVGLIKFLDCYYMTLITRRQKVGQIGGEAIYTVKSTEMIPLRGCVQGEHKRQENNSKGSEDDDRSQGDESGEQGAPGRSAKKERKEGARGAEGAGAGGETGPQVRGGASKAARPRRKRERAATQGRASKAEAGRGTPPPPPPALL
jgi:hypothetical protein